MRFSLPLLLVILCGCCGPRPNYISPDTPQAYFDELPSVAIPESQYQDENRTKWYSIGYREGWQRGDSGVPASFDPWYPQHEQCERVAAYSEAHRKGFDKGFDAGFKVAQQRLAHLIESVREAADRVSDL